MLQTAEMPSFTESASIYQDTDGWRHLFLGGEFRVNKDDGWQSRTNQEAPFTGSSTVTLMCG
ncbi:MAG: hypothetical protein OXE59_09750 [Bacteroidetes bacterium]|nr:hypothetical protein [Bacteroidota bacterium]MCY4234004.1 hypothetical protein [Bacteroidota bacterium]